MKMIDGLLAATGPGIKRDAAIGDFPGASVELPRSHAQIRSALAALKISVEGPGPDIDVTMPKDPPIYRFLCRH
jgi:hypothetical protein